ncbi:hypothetical protein QTN93_15100 [Sphingomonas aerolata]|uniref:hypothetical protein n=1 Tax=Sphingomonas aerolata TaxID=185951 RepID=UPI0035A64825
MSIGTVRIANADEQIKEWVATPDKRTYSGIVAPGYYTATIIPSGMASQSVIFEVRAGEDNRVTVPAFASLIASSGNTTFLKVSDQLAAIDALFGGATKVDVSPPAATAGLLGILDTGPAAEAPLTADHRGEPAVDASKSKADAVPWGQRLSIGLSKEAEHQSDSFRAFSGRASMALSEARLELVVTGPDAWSPLSGERVRLSVAIENVRVERLLLPMYRGGVQITIVPSHLSSNDVELEVLPNDPRLRALVRSLITGTREEAKAVRPLVRTADDLLNVDTVVDPWEAILSVLLSIRFPDDMPPFTAALADGLVALAPWAYDSYVIQARQRLYSASSDAERAAAAPAALEMLRKAQACGSPYFNYVNQLFSEMIEWLYRRFDTEPPDQSTKRAVKIRDRWFREQSLQSKAGASFSWLARDEAQLKNGLLAPNRKPSGLLGQSATILFSGHLLDGGIRMDTGQAQAPAKEVTTSAEASIEFGNAPVSCPALTRPPGPENDPNLGRFGGHDTTNGYSLKTHFRGDQAGNVVLITMTIEAAPGTQIAPGAVAWFCLHPTFNPQWVKVIFGNDRAVLSLQSLGGFTVGVWLPESGVELESDLAKLPDAPRIVRER